MPELPEVETIVEDLKKKVLNRTFLNVWTDAPKLIKKPKSFKDFQKSIKGKKVIKVWRRAKNIIFELSGGYILLIHQKMTGHLLYGKWKLKNNKWQAEDNPVLQEKVNSYIHLLFFLDNNWMLALSDLRKFAKAELWDRSVFLNSKEYNSIGPEPLEKSFTLDVLKDILKSKEWRIKKLLMDQSVIAGIGNIYADEILWQAKIHPLQEASKINNAKAKLLYESIKKILKKAVKLRGESFSDFRDLMGEKGFFDTERKAYQREGEKCSRCGTRIKRIKINGRSSHYCPHCQKL